MKAFWKFLWEPIEIPAWVLFILTLDTILYIVSHWA